MPNSIRSTHFVVLLFVLSLLASVGCNRNLTPNAAGQMSRADSLLLAVLPLDTLAAHVQAKRAAVHPDSVHSGNWVVRLDDPAELEAIRVHFFKKGWQAYPGSWARQQACYRRDLRSNDIDVRREALAILGDRMLTSTDSTDAELRKLVYRQMHDKDIAMLAIQSVPTIDPDHAADSIIDLLQTSQQLDPIVYNEGLRTLGRTIPKAKTIDFLKNQLHKGRGNRSATDDFQTSAAIRGLLYLHDHADSILCRSIEETLFDYHEDYPMEDFDLQGLVWRMAKRNPLPRYLPLFEAHVNDSDVRSYAILGIAKIKGAGAQELVTTYLQDSTLSYAYPDAIPFAWTTDPGGALPLLLQGYQAPPSPTQLDRWLEAVWNTGGKDLANAFVAQIRNLDERQELQAYFHLLYEPIQADHPLQREAARLTQMGLLDADTGMEFLDSIQAAHRENGDADFDGAVLKHLACITRIDTRPDSLLNSYLDDLVTYGFKRGAARRLDDLEFYFSRGTNSPGKKREDLWFIFHDHAYYTDIDVAHGKVPSDRICFVLNQILSDAGIPERFHPIPDYSQWEQPYLFAKPDIAPKAIELLRFLLPGQRYYGRPDHVHVTM